jgi:hypothetical protein
MAGIRTKARSPGTPTGHGGGAAGQATMLYAIEVPETGGETWWACQYAAYDALPEDEKRRYAGMRATHNLDFSRNRRHPEEPRRSTTPRRSGGWCAAPPSTARSPGCRPASADGFGAGAKSQVILENYAARFGERRDSFYKIVSIY